jgi:Domain of unknown function (DUF4262)
MTRQDAIQAQQQREIREMFDLHMKGPPSLVAQRQAEAVSGGEVEFPAGGMVFHTGRLYRPAEGDLPACFGLVERRYYEDYFGQAIVYHGSAEFQVLQFVWSDTHGLFLWEDGYEARLRGKQDLLFDPQQYLPLQEGEA